MGMFDPCVLTASRRAPGTRPHKRRWVSFGGTCPGGNRWSLNPVGWRVRRVSGPGSCHQGGQFPVPARAGPLPHIRSNRQVDVLQGQRLRVETGPAVNRPEDGVNGVSSEACTDGPRESMRTDGLLHGAAPCVRVPFGTCLQAFGRTPNDCIPIVRSHRRSVCRRGDTRSVNGATPQLACERS